MNESGDVIVQKSEQPTNRYAELVYRVQGHLNGEAVFWGAMRRRAWSRTDRILRSSRWRHRLIPIFGFAIPNEAALRLIERHAPILEVGAGCGYWASLLRARGVDMLVTDKSPKKWGYWTWKKKWTLVERHDHRIAKKANDSALLMIWPDYNDAWAEKALKGYRGDTVIYIGEGHGGCTADDGFHELLDKKWTKHDTVNIPTWWGVRDYLMLYKR
jgi:hypothetical protein